MLNGTAIANSSDNLNFKISTTVHYQSGGKKPILSRSVSKRDSHFHPTRRTNFGVRGTGNQKSCHRKFTS